MDFIDIYVLIIFDCWLALFDHLNIDIYQSVGWNGFNLTDGQIFIIDWREIQCVCISIFNLWVVVEEILCVS